MNSQILLALLAYLAVGSAVDTTTEINEEEMRKAMYESMKAAGGVDAFLKCHDKFTKEAGGIPDPEFDENGKIKKINIDTACFGLCMDTEFKVLNSSGLPHSITYAESMKVLEEKLKPFGDKHKFFIEMLWQMQKNLKQCEEGKRPIPTYEVDYQTKFSKGLPYKQENCVKSYELDKCSMNDEYNGKKVTDKEQQECCKKMQAYMLENRTKA